MGSPGQADARAGRHAPPSCQLPRAETFSALPPRRSPPPLSLPGGAGQSSE